LNPGVSLDQAQAEMATIDSRIARRPGRPPLIVSLHEESVRRVRSLLNVFLGAVGFLLLIACTNVANLLLGRAAARQREIAIRSALGSGRWRLIRQALTESVLLGLVGGAAGLILALFGLDLLIGLIPAGSVPRLAEVKVDGQVLAFTFALSFLTGLVFGIAPALQSTATDLSAALKTSGTSQTTRARLPNAFVVAQVALTVVLLSGAGLMVRSFLNLTAVDPGFRPARVTTASVSLPESSYSGYDALRPFSAQVLERIRSAPGVEQASAINWLPFGQNLISGDFTAEGVEMPRGLVVAKPAVSTDYFATMGIPLLRGRALSNQDTERSELVAVVTDQLARQLWPGRDAIGERLKLGFGRPSEEPWRSVVGVVGDIKQNSQGETTRPAIYVPLEQAPGKFLLRDVSFVARSAADPMAIASAMRDALRAVDSTLPIDRMRTMDELLAEAASEPRFRSVVLASFATAALLLVATGVFGVLAYAVARRRRELGVRMALGADRGRLVGLVVRHTLRMTVMGLALGLIGAVALTRILTAYLFAVRPLDPATLAGAAAIVLAAALLATYVPARRAASVDPLEALRAE
jgi:putative ABC transport system permease protein